MTGGAVKVRLMPTPYSYAVRAKFETEALAREWMDWLTHGHLADVVKAGALRAMLVQLAPLEAEARYVFASEAAFKAYEAGPAVALRAEGAAKFPPSRGVTMTRAQGPVLLEVGEK